MKKYPKYSNGELISISVENGFKKAKMMRIERPYLYTEDYVTHFNDKIFDSITGEEKSVLGSYVIIFGNYKERVGKLISKQEFEKYSIHLPSQNTRPGIAYTEDQRIYLIKQMDQEFSFEKDDKILVGKKSDFLVAIPETEEYWIFEYNQFKMNFKLMEN